MHVLTNATRQMKVVKRSDAIIHFVNNATVHLENPKGATETILEIIRESSEVSNYRVNRTLVAFLCMKINQILNKINSYKI